MGFSPLSLGTFVLTLGSSVNFHIHWLASHHYHTGKLGNDLRLGGDHTEQLWEEMDRDPKRAGQGAYWHHLPYCWTQASSDTETPIFPVCVCVTVPSSCVFTHVCLCHPCLCVFLCVCMCLAHIRLREEGDRIWDLEEQEEEARDIHRLGETCQCISVAPLSKTGRKKGWPVTSLDSGSTNLQLHQET